jgi:RNA polymerase sigma-70 factor (ECF subfamily)
VGASNNKPQFDILVDAHAAEIYRYLWRMLQNEQDAEDCLQDAFLKAYLAYGRLDGSANYRAWLYRIAGNTARTRLRGRLRTGILLTEDLADSALPIEQQAQNQEQLEAVKDAIEALPYKQRESLILRKYQELSYEEISTILDTSVEGARANVYQGLSKLRAQFESADSVAVPNLAEENSEVGQ